jgi:polysaccharide export outer membrane protein
MCLASERRCEDRQTPVEPIEDATMKHLKVMMAIAMAAVVWADASVFAQAGGQKPPAQTSGSTAKPKGPTPPPPPPGLVDFVIGPADVLRIDVFGEAALSGDFVVRPDGKISMVQIDELVAAGQKPEELKQKIKTELKRFFEEPVPEVFVQVKQINSRNIFVDGAVNRRGPIPVIGEMRVSQAITLAGGLTEFADKKKILVISGTQKKPNGDPVTWIINYDDISNAKNLQKNNILLNPGDQIIVRGG